MVPMFVFGIVFFLSLFLLGRFSATMARLENNRLLRPGAGYMLLNAWLCLAVAVGIVFVAGGAVTSGFLRRSRICAFCLRSQRSRP